MKLLLSALLFFIVFNSSAQLTVNVGWTQKSNMPAVDVIYYDSSRALMWKDFAGNPPDDHAITAALTVSGFGYNAGIKTIDGKGELNVTIYCYFNKTKSWVKPGKNTAYILVHEQHHFDVSFIAAAAFADKLRQAKFTNSNYNTLLPKLYSECCDLMNKMQNDYDGQTKNGQLKDEQSRWNELIFEKLHTIN